MELAEQLAQRGAQKNGPHCPRRRHYIDIPVYTLRWESGDGSREPSNSMTDVRTLGTLIQEHIWRQIMILGLVSN